LKLAGKYFELLAHFGADPRALAAASRAAFFLGRKIVLDLDPLELFGQLLTAMLVTILDATRDELFAIGFGFDAGHVERHGVDELAEQQKLPRIERFAARAVVAPQQRLNRGLQFGFVTRSLRGELRRGFVAKALDERVALDEQLSLARDNVLLILDEQLLQQRRIIRQRGEIGGQIGGGRGVLAHALYMRRP